MFKNYYYYKNGNQTVSGDIFAEDIAIQMAALIFNNDTIEKIYVTDNTTGEIIREFQK